MSRLGDERGVAAIWVAVDASEFWEDARFEQNVADLACLAGVRHLPEDPAAARQMAAEFTRQNWPSLQGVSATLAGNEAA